MTDRIGVLGESSNTTLGTHTVYTCPANKSAKVQIFSRFQGGATSQVAVLINGIEVARCGSMTVNHYNFTVRGGGMFGQASGQAAAPSGLTNKTTVGLNDQAYYMSAGDMVQYTVIGTGLVNMNIQAVGVEVDA